MFYTKTHSRASLYCERIMMKFLTKRQTLILSGIGFLGMGVTTLATANNACPSNIYNKDSNGKFYCASTTQTNDIGFISNTIAATPLTNNLTVGPAAGTNNRFISENIAIANTYEQPTYQASSPTPAATLAQAPAVSSATTRRDCTPHAGAAKVGIKHYKFQEAAQHELVELPSRYRAGGGQNRYVHQEALAPLTKMIDDAKQDGVTLTVGSAFRSVAYQRGLKGGKPNAGVSAWRSSAPAGYSEHHTGFAVDFNPINSSFGNTAGYRWLKANAHKYGWYQTFTSEYSRASGVIEEAWHWKYTGSETAKNYTINATCLLGR